MKSYFFNAEPTNDLVSHPTGYDREYDANSHAEFFEPFFSKAGVFAGSNADACRVTVVSGTKLAVGAGAVYARGRMAVFDGTETVTAAESCTVVARMNKSSEVRGFQLLAVTEVVESEDLHDVPLAEAALVAIPGGYEVQLTDRRAFMAFTGQPPYYPPSADNLPYVLWLYTLGFPMTAEQRAAVEANPSLMGIFNESIGAVRTTVVTFTTGDWVKAGESKTITIPRSVHRRPNGNFDTSLWHLTERGYVRNAWCVLGTDVRYNAETGDIVLDCPDAYAGKAQFHGGDCRPADIATVALHNAMPYAHGVMEVDGNTEAPADDAQTLEEHMRSVRAHQNLALDGNGLL